MSRPVSAKIISNYTVKDYKALTLGKENST